MAVNQRVQAAAVRVEEAGKRVSNVVDSMLENIEDITPIQGIPLTDLDDEDSAVIAVAEVLRAAPGSQSAAGPTSSPKRRARTEPGVTKLR